MRVELESLYERRSLVTAAILALERWREMNLAADRREENRGDASNLSTCPHA